MAELGESGRNSLSLLRGWADHLSKDNVVSERVASQYNEALVVIGPDLGKDLSAYQISPSDLQEFHYYGTSRSDRMSKAGPASATGSRWVVAPEFFSKLSAAIRYIEEQLSQPVAKEQPMSNEVFVIHGRDEDAKELVFQILQAVDLKPRDFNQWRRQLHLPSPYIGDVIDLALKRADAFLVLFTGDERAVLRDDLKRPNDPDDPEPSPRPNVILEAGMALAKASERTVIIEWGEVRKISDLDGVHNLRWYEDTPENREELIARLEFAGCRPNRNAGSRWMNVGKRSSAETSGNGR